MPRRKGVRRGVTVEKAEAVDFSFSASVFMSPVSTEVEGPGALSEYNFRRRDTGYRSVPLGAALSQSPSLNPPISLSPSARL